MIKSSRTVGARSMKVGLAALILAGAGMAGAGQAKPARTHDQKAVRAIVRFRTNPTPGQLARLASLGFDLTRHLQIIHSVAGSASAANLRRIAELQDVLSVTNDLQVRKTDAFTTTSSLSAAASQQFGVSGNGVGVAILDSGIDKVEDLEATTGEGSRVQARVDFTGLGKTDQCGHGTHVAGIVAGNGSDSTGSIYSQTFMGVAPGASLVGVRVLDNTGAGSVSNVIAGVQWTVSNAAKYNIRVLNISMGHPVTQSYTTDPLNLAVEAAWQAGIVVVVAAGNSGRLNATPTVGADNGGYGTAYGSIECPGNDPYVITVGAMKSIDGSRADDQVATYSGRGPSAGDLILKPDVVAPGNLVVSTEGSRNDYLMTNYGPVVDVKDGIYKLTGNPNKVSGKYMILSGTSMATPVVSGAVALMLQQQPGLTPDTIKARLMVSADKWLQPDGTADACTFGAGYVNVLAAMNSQIVATTPALSPALVQPTNGNWALNLDPSIYGQRAMWGTGITNLQTIYGQRAMWGTSFDQINANRAMWGTSFDQLNASRAMWGTGLYTLTATSVSSAAGVDTSSSSFLISGE